MWTKITAYHALYAFKYLRPKEVDHNMKGLSTLRNATRRKNRLQRINVTVDRAKDTARRVIKKK